MKRIAVLLTLFLTYVSAEAQIESIMKAIEVESISQAREFIRNREDSTVKLLPSICPYWIDSKMDSLVPIMDKAKIQSFLSHENGVVKIVGFWLLAQKADSGLLLQNTLEVLLSKEPQPVMTGCGDVYQTDLVAEYCYKLVTKRYPFNEKLLKLNRRQRKELKPLLEKYKMQNSKPTR